MLSRWEVALLNVGIGIRFDFLQLLQLGRRIVYRVDGSYVKEVFEREGNPWLPNYDRINSRIKIALQRCDHVVYQSEFSKRYLDHLYQRSNGAYSVIHNGVDLEVFKPRQSRVNDIPVIGCIGTFRLNRVHTIMDISRRIPFDHRLLLAGRMDEQSEAYLRSSREAHNQHCVLDLVPPVKGDNHLAVLHQMVDCYIHPVIGDTCANAVVEALACGVPVIVPRFGGTAEVVGDGGIQIDTPRWIDYGGFLNEFVTAIETVLTKHNQYSVQARDQAVRFLDVNLMAAKYRSALRLD